MSRPSLMAVLAHPDDESLGVGGTLATYAAAGIDVHLVTATRGQAGRYRGLRQGADGHPGADALGEIRAAELREAAGVLGVGEVTILDFADGRLDTADHRRVIGSLVGHIRRIRPAVVLTFDPDGAYGHPDHIAISQFTTAAVLAAASPALPGASGFEAAGRPHAVAKLYYLAWPASTWTAYETAIGALTSTVDGIERRATPWPDWAITTVIDTRAVWPTVARAIACHESQVSGYERLTRVRPEHHEALWGAQSFYRALSLVNGGRTREHSLFEGLDSG